MKLVTIAAKKVSLAVTKHTQIRMTQGGFNKRLFTKYRQGTGEREDTKGIGKPQ